MRLMRTSKTIAVDGSLINPKEEEGTCQMNYYGRSEKSDKIEKLLLWVHVSGILSGPLVEGSFISLLAQAILVLLL